MSFRTLDDLGDVHGKRALVRVDLNVPMADGEVTDDTRFRATLPTVTELADRGAIVLLLAHFGRPKGANRPDLSLSRVHRPHAPARGRRGETRPGMSFPLSTRPYEQVLGRPVRFVGDCQGDLARDNIAQMRPGD